jgi:hypothetical protein
LSEHNKTRALVILTPGLAMWSLLLLHLPALACEGIVLSLLRRDMRLLREVYAPAIAAPFTEWQALRALRAETQATRNVPLARWFSVVRWHSRKLAMLLHFGIPSVR